MKFPDHPAKSPRHVLRNVAILLIEVAEKVDPQPPITSIWPFTIHTGPSIKTAEARITWHETC